MDKFGRPWKVEPYPSNRPGAPYGAWVRSKNSVVVCQGELGIMTLICLAVNEQYAREHPVEAAHAELNARRECIRENVPECLKRKGA